jgi:hypothetical protein
MADSPRTLPSSSLPLAMLQDFGKNTVAQDLGSGLGLHLPGCVTFSNSINYSEP